MTDSTVETGRPRSPAPLQAGNEHPLLHLPFGAVIEGRRYRGEGISLVEARVGGLIDPVLDGSEHVVRLVFDFPGFQIALTPMARIEVVNAGEMHLVFSDPAGEHHGQLRRILNDWISGDVTTTGELIHSTSPDAGRTARQRPRRGIGGWLRSLVGALVVLGLSVALIALAASLVGARVLTQDLPSTGRIVPAGQVLRATADGQIAYLDLDAPQGEVLYAIDTSGGETLSVAAPCDCEVRAMGLSEGSTVLAGEPVVTVSDEAAPAIVEARLPERAIFAIQRAGAVEVTLPDGSSFGATVESIGARDRDGNADVRLSPAVALPDAALGRMARLSISKDPVRALRRLGDEGRALWDEAVGAQALLGNND